MNDSDEQSLSMTKVCLHQPGFVCDLLTKFLSGKLVSLCFTAFP